MKQIISDELYLENASGEDIESIYTQCESLIQRYEDSTNVDIPKALSWVKRKIENSISDYRVIFYANQKVGYVSVHKEEGVWELDDFYIFDAYQGNGIGSQVLEYLVKKYDRMFLYVFKNNVGAISLYKKYGFDVVEEVGTTRLIMERR